MELYILAEVLGVNSTTKDAYNDSHMGYWALGAIGARIKATTRVS